MAVRKGQVMLSVGDPAPDFTLADADGNSVKLSDFKVKIPRLVFKKIHL